MCLCVTLCLWKTCRFGALLPFFWRLSSADGLRIHLNLNWIKSLLSFIICSRLSLAPHSLFITKIYYPQRWKLFNKPTDSETKILLKIFLIDFHTCLSDGNKEREITFCHCKCLLYLSWSCLFSSLVSRAALMFIMTNVQEDLNHLKYRNIHFPENIWCCFSEIQKYKASPHFYFKKHLYNKHYHNKFKNSLQKVNKNTNTDTKKPFKSTGK